MKCRCGESIEILGILGSLPITLKVIKDKKYFTVKACLMVYMVSRLPIQWTGVQGRNSLGGIKNINPALKEVCLQQQRLSSELD